MVTSFFISIEYTTILHRGHFMVNYDRTEMVSSSYFIAAHNISNTSCSSVKSKHELKLAVYKNFNYYNF